MSKSKVARSKTEYDVSLQRREGKTVAIIEATSIDILEDGRGYAGQSTTARQVIVVPLMSLPDLSEQIVRTLAFNATASPEDRYDLETDAQPSIGLYSSERDQVDTFYTVAEARTALEVCPSGYAIAHLPRNGEEWYFNIIERNQ